jgi:hypothetical protein
MPRMPLVTCAEKILVGQPILAVIFFDYSTDIWLIVARARSESFGSTKQFAEREEQKSTLEGA